MRFLFQALFRGLLGLFLAVALNVAALSVPALADCGGKDLIAALAAKDLARLRAEVADEPFASGNFWLARRGAQVVTLLGTLHLDDPRFEPIVQSLRPRLASAGLLLVEAGPDQQTAMKDAAFHDPSLILLPASDSLQDRLSAPQWQALTAALGARGLPAIMAARMRPWILMAMLSIPPCETKAMLANHTEVPNGLDQRLTGLAQGFNVPVQSLEAWDAALKTLTGLPPDRELQLLTGALALDDQSGDITATLTTAYFAGDSRLFWQFYRGYALGALQIADPALAATAAQDNEAMMALLEGPLIRDRNRSWISVIDAASAKAGKPIVVAFGALHLSGADGVLNLLVADGWTVTPLSLAGP